MSEDTIEYKGKTYERMLTGETIADGDLATNNPGCIEGIITTTCAGMEVGEWPVDNAYYREVASGKTYYQLTVDNDKLTGRIEELEKELSETQEDLTEQIKENSALEAAIAAMKPEDAEATQRHIQLLGNRLQQLESILTSMAMAFNTYHVAGKA
jgi:septal ring factor EnvC (AmiA/AmiB activator)